MEASAKEVITCHGVNQDFDAIKVSTEFIKEDLCEPEDSINDDNFNIKSVNLVDVYDNKDNISVDSNSSLQELIANSSCGEPLVSYYLLPSEAIHQRVLYCDISDITKTGLISRYQLRKNSFDR